MKITDDSQITFEDWAVDKRTHWQKVIFNGETIGALAQWSESLIEPTKERYQVCVPESEADNPLLDDWYITEDEGFIFACFHTLEKFIEYYNSKIN